MRFLAFGRVVLYLLFVFLFCARRAKKRKTDKTLSTLLPQAGYLLGVAFEWGAAQVL
jgi:hypothetical protein